MNRQGDPHTKAMLEGIRVLDFSRFGAGPYCAMLLADREADVIRVEAPGGGYDRITGLLGHDGSSLTVKALNRNKRGITLNLRKDTSEMREVLRKLVERSDVVLHNFVHGTPEADILSYEQLKESNRKIITASITGWGNTGPYADWAAYGACAEAMTGAFWSTGFPGNPPLRCSIPYADLSAAVTTAFGIMVALWQRQQTGEGQDIDCAMFDTLVAWVQVTGAVLLHEVWGEQRWQIGNSGYTSFNDNFKAKDGWVFIAVIADSGWKRFCELIGKPEWIGHPLFKSDVSRFSNRHAISLEVADWVAQRTVWEAVNSLQEVGVPAAPVYTTTQMMEDPQVKAREMIVHVDTFGVGEIPLPGITPKLSKSPDRIRLPCPMIGEHNEEIYCGLLRFSLEKLSQLKKNKVV